MTDYPCNNNTIGDKIRKEYKRPYHNNVIVIAFGSFIREATQCILPNPP